MNELVDANLQENLFEMAAQPQPIQFQHRRSDVLFYKAYQHFRMLNILQSAYSMAKVLACLIIFVMEVWVWELPCDLQAVWCLLLAPVSLLQFLSYRMASNATGSLRSFLFLAETLEHIEYIHQRDLPAGHPQPVSIETSFNKDVFDFNNEEAGEQRDDKKVNILAIQIKYQAQQLNTPLLVTARLSFALYQGLHFWALYLYFWAPTQSSLLLEKYMMVVLIIGTYQYLEIYVIAIVVSIFLPFYGIVQLVRMCFLRINSAKFIRMLKPKKFSAADVKGQHECSVCLLAYTAEDRIITLPCNERHHFHSFCIQTWLKVSITCPICRQSFSNLDRTQTDRLLAELN